MSSGQVVPDSYWVSSLRGLRNGIFYGGKVRFTHALVMTLLFRGGSFQDKIHSVVKLTYEHAKNLGLYVFLYKSIVYLLTKLRGKSSKYHAFVGGVIAGYIIFGKKTNVNYQIVLYLLSRVIIGGTENLVKKKKLPDIKLYPFLAAIVWGIIMFLFEDDASTVQPSLASSMNFLYRESNTYRSWVDFVPIKLPNFLISAINSLFLAPGGNQ